MDDIPILDEEVPALGRKPSDTPKDGDLLDEGHYQADGKRVARVTHVLSKVVGSQGLAWMKANRPEALKEAADEGTELHRLATWWLRGRDVRREHMLSMVEHTVPEHRRVWLRRFITWSDRRVKRILGMEAFVWWTGDAFHCGYGGSIDLVAELDDGHVWVVDYKTGAHDKNHFLQTAAYCRAWNKHNDEKAKRRLLLYIPRGADRIEELYLNSQWLNGHDRIWMSVLMSYTWGAM